MDRLELLTKVSGRVEKFRPEGYDDLGELCVRKLTAMERAKFAEACRISDKSKEDDNALEVVTVNVSALVVSKGLVDEKGERYFKDDELEAIAAKFPSDLLDAIAEKILVISKLKSPVKDEIKNSDPAPIESSN